MPKGLNAQKRPGDLIGGAIMVAKIATGEFENAGDEPTKEHHSRGGKKGGG